MPAVVAALHDDNVVASRLRPGEANGVVGRLRSRVGQHDLVDGGYVLDQHLRQSPLPGVGSRTHEGDLVVEHLADGSVDVGIVVAKEIRRKGGVIVDILVAFQVPDATTPSPDERDPRRRGAVHGDDASRDDLAVCFEQSL